jgi:hypothetical protein
MGTDQRLIPRAGGVQTMLKRDGTSSDVLLRCYQRYLRYRKTVVWVVGYEAEFGDGYPRFQKARLAVNVCHISIKPRVVFYLCRT